MRKRIDIRDPYYTKAKFKSVCAETGRTLNVGDRILYSPQDRKAYHPDSNRALEWNMIKEDDLLSNSNL